MQSQHTRQYNGALKLSEMKEPNIQINHKTKTNKNENTNYSAIRIKP
jgi:hypothetical protein